MCAYKNTGCFSIGSAGHFWPRTPKVLQDFQPKGVLSKKKTLLNFSVPDFLSRFPCFKTESSTACVAFAQSLRWTASTGIQRDLSDFEQIYRVICLAKGLFVLRWRETWKGSQPTHPLSLSFFFENLFEFVSVQLLVWSGSLCFLLTKLTVNRSEHKHHSSGCQTTNSQTNETQQL